MKKLFISQPMRGKSDEEILKEREKAIKSAEKQMDEPVEVIDSFFQSAPTDARPLWYLGESLKLLATADVAYFAKGWEKARGCKIEHTCAVEYGIPKVIVQHNFRDKENDLVLRTAGEELEVPRKRAEYLANLQLVKIVKAQKGGDPKSPIEAED